mgnify:FL=1
MPECAIIPNDFVLNVFSMIVKQAQHAADIVRRLRSLVQKTPFQRFEFCLQETLSEVELLMSHDLWSQKVRVEFSVPDNDVVIVGDRIQIEQVLINLIRNSMDAYGPYVELASPAKAGAENDQRKVWVAVHEASASVELTVSDRAGGVEQSMAGSLFEPYVSSKADGIGMGLSISRSIVEAHGGQIRVESDYESMTTFTIILPKE